MTISSDGNTRSHKYCSISFKLVKCDRTIGFILVLQFINCRNIDLLLKASNLYYILLLHLTEDFSCIGNVLL